MNNKPIRQIRDGALKVAIWQNKTEENGNFYSTVITRTYKDAKENFHDTDSFNGSDLLRIARLANMAYDLIVELKQQDREARK